MKKAFSKALAVLLTGVLAVSLLPMEILANMQLRVNTLEITNLPAATGYNFTLNWDQPPASQKVDPVASAPSYSMTQRAVDYDLSYRNTTDRQSYPAPFKTIKDTSENPVVNLNDLPLLNGKFYMFKVDAFHTHTIQRPNPNGIGTYSEEVRATYDETNPLSEVLYLTDIGVTASGTGKVLTVQWDNPTMDGQAVFDGFNIYYAPGGPAVDPASLNNKKKPVNMNDPNLVVTSDGRLSYKIEDNSLIQGSLYAVKVEPIYSNAELRGLDKNPVKPQRTITVRNKDYRLAYTNREYRTNQAYVKPALDLSPYGLDELLLTWTSMKTDSDIDITKVGIERSDSGTFSDVKEIGALFGTECKDNNTWKTPKPNKTTSYRVVVYYRDTNGQEATMVSEIAVYNPEEEQFTPTKPEILQIVDSPNLPVIMNVTWKAFERLPYNEYEKNFVNSRGWFVDTDVKYDIWVTDDLLNFQDPLFMGQKTVSNLIANIDLRPSDFTYTNAAGEEVTYASYHYDLKNYVGVGKNGYEIRPLEDNKIYYIKIVATRTTSKGQVSEPAFGSFFVMPKGDIATRPVMVSKPPLRIKKDKDGVEMITKDSITIQWDLRWFEAYCPTDKNWYSEIGIAQDNTTFVFGDSITDDLRDAGRVLSLNHIKYTEAGSRALGEQAIRDDLKAIAPNLAAAIDLIPLRLMDLGDAQYEIHVVEYDTMMKAGGYEEYAKNVEENDWQSVIPGGDPMHPDATVTLSNKPLPGALNPNTAYAILFKPFIVLPDGVQKAYYPNVIIATTLSDRPPVDVIPTVPRLEPVKEEDVSLTVRFEYVDSLGYELSYSENMPDYPDKGQVVASEDIKRNGRVVTEGGIKYMYVDIKGLFPQTNYYIWIRAKANNSAGPLYSAWSNPIIMKTTDLIPPEPPQGLGLAAESHLEIINNEDNVKLFPVGEDYMIIEWLKNEKDGTAPDSAKIASVTGGDAEALGSLSLPNNFLVKFNKLLANKPYYVRGKTLLTVTKTGQGGQTGQAGQNQKGIAAYYQYVIQISLDQFFVDCIEVIIPALSGPTDPLHTIVKESGWTDAYYFYTGQTTGEYDGDKNPDLYPLPDKDYEYIYDRATDTLTMRFRSDGTGADGNKDNQVDQRFITRLIHDKVFDYVVDVSSYNNKRVKNHVLIMPYSIADAFSQRKINLTIKAGDTAYTFSPGFMNNADVKSAAGYGANAKIQIAMNEYPAGLPTLSVSRETYATPPQKLTVTLSGPSKSMKLSSFGNPVEVRQKISSRSLAVDKNLDSYSYEPNNTGWTRANGRYDSASGQLSFTTMKPINFAAIAINKPAQNSYDKTAEDSMMGVNSAIRFTDLPNYNPAASVSAWQFNKAIVALAAGQKDVAINSALTEEETNTLKNSGLLTPGASTIKREAAINALVKLYEMKTKSQIKNYTGLTETLYQDIAGAASQYRNGLLKAGDLGFYSSAKNANPGGNLNFADFLYMLDIIVKDSGD